MAYGFLHRGRRQDAGGRLWTADEVASASLTTLGLICVLAAVILLLAADLHAQTSTVIGTITYHNGKPAVNVYVSIAGRYRYTDVGGRYKIEGVPQGHQQMTIKTGKKILWQGDAIINGTIATVNRVLP
jgi:hypothetical protein